MQYSDRGNRTSTVFNYVMLMSTSEMSQLSFDHLLNLSFAWHTRRKTGEILRVLDRGAAINHTFEVISAYLILELTSHSSLAHSIQHHPDLY